MNLRYVWHLIVVVLWAELLAYNAARGAVVYSNLGAGDTFSTDIEAPVTGTLFFLGDSNAAGAFTVGGSSFVLDSVEMALRWYDPDEINDQEPLVVRLFGDSGGLPGAELASVQLNQFPPTEPALVTVDFSPAALMLNSGTTYWLIGDTSGTSWFGWMDNITGDLGLAYTNNSPTWFINEFIDAPAFRINGTRVGVPEPGALVIASGYLAGFLAVRRRSGIAVGRFK